MSTLCTLKIRGIGNWNPELATGPLLLRKISENDKIATFSHLSGVILLTQKLRRTALKKVNAEGQEKKIEILLYV